MAPQYPLTYPARVHQVPRSPLSPGAGPEKIPISRAGKAKAPPKALCLFLYNNTRGIVNRCGETFKFGYPLSPVYMHVQSVFITDRYTKKPA